MLYALLFALFAWWISLFAVLQLGRIGWPTLIASTAYVWGFCLAHQPRLTAYGTTIGLSLIGVLMLIPPALVASRKQARNNHTVNELKQLGEDYAVEFDIYRARSDAWMYSYKNEGDDNTLWIE